MKKESLSLFLPGQVYGTGGRVLKLNQVLKVLFILFFGSAILLCSACSTAPELQERQVSMTLTKSAPAISGGVSSESLYYFSVYNWLSYQNNSQSQEGARHSLQRAVKADPGSLYLRLELAEVLFKLHQVNEAQMHAEIALELDPGNQRARRLLAATYTLTGDKERAVRQYEELLTEDPENSEALFYLVALYVETLQYEKALDLLKGYRQKYPDDVLAPYYQGKIYAELKLYGEAERYFKEALEIEPEMADAWLNLGLIYEFTERREEAVDAYRKLLDIDGGDRQALERLGQLLVGDGNLDAALKIFQRLKEQGDVPASINVKIALIYFQQGNYQQAAEILKELHAEFPERYRITFYLASSLEALEYQDEALALFLSIPETDELFYDARVHAAFLYERRKEFKACEAVLTDLIAKYPKKVGLARMLAALHQKQDDDQGALEILQQSLALHPDDYKLRFALGVVYNDLGQIAESIAVMQGLLKDNPEDAAVLNFIGYTYVEQGVQLDDAEKLLQRALEIKPDSGYILDSMGWLFYMRKDYEKALEYLLAAKKKMDDDPILFEHLGDINLALEDYDEALKNYNSSLELKEDKNIREKMEKLLQKVK